MARSESEGRASREKPGEFQGSPRMGTALISGATFTSKSVTYYDVDGIAIVEGDIALGTVASVEAATAAGRQAASADPTIARGVGITGSQFRWPNCRIPYEIDPNLPNQQRVTDAIAHWEANTPFRFPLRTAANAGQFPNYVRFQDAGGCWSLVGMQGGQQAISLGTGCSTGNAIHEIGHTVGLWHEQSREDRDLFVTINWQNIQAGMAAQFNQHITDGDDLGAYDYGSIMHYPRTAFSANGQDTITPTDPNAQIGQRNGLSAGDIAAVQAMYPGCFVKQPFLEPGGFKKIRDDNLPFKKIRDDVVPFKKIRDDNPPFKKIRDDVVPFKKIRDDVVIGKPLRDPGPVKMAFDPMPGPGTVVQPGPVLPGTVLPGTLQPFTIATPHHALLAGAPAEGGAAGGATQEYLESLQRQLVDLEAALATAHATAAQAAAEAARLQEATDAVTAALGRALDELGGGS